MKEAEIKKIIDEMLNLEERDSLYPVKDLIAEEVFDAVNKNYGFRGEFDDDELEDISDMIFHEIFLRDEKHIRKSLSLGKDDIIIWGSKSIDEAAKSIEFCELDELESEEREEVFRAFKNEFKYSKWGYIKCFF